MFLSAFNQTPVRKTRRVSIIYWSTLVQKFPSREPFTSYSGRRKKIARKIHILWGKILRNK